MAKKLKHPSAKASQRKRKISVAWDTKLIRFVAVYLATFVIGLVILVGSKGIPQPQPICANSKTCTSDLSERIENGAIGMFEGHQVIPPKVDLALDNTKQSVLGDNVTNADKHIYIDLAAQTLYAYDGNTKIMQTFIASGRWGRTPVGNFHVWEKLRSTRMAGGSGADAYDLPNVTFVMYFYHDFGLHTAYWHDNFGHTMSHGCVNMRQVDAEALYNWADGPSNGQKGTAVSVCERFSEPNGCSQTNPIES